MILPFVTKMDIVQLQTHVSVLQTTLVVLIVQHQFVVNVWLMIHWYAQVGDLASVRMCVNVMKVTRVQIARSQPVLVALEMDSVSHHILVSAMLDGWDRNAIFQYVTV